MSVRLKFSVFTVIMMTFTTFVIYGLGKPAFEKYQYIKSQLPVSAEVKESRLSLYLRENLKDINRKAAKLKIPTDGVYLGVDTELDKNKLRKYEGRVGKRIAILNYYVYWGEKKSQFDFDLASRLWVEDKALLITWNPSRSLISNAVDQPKFRLKRILTGDYDGYINDWVVSLKKWNKPVVIRFAPEMNGYWVSWGTKFNSAKEYILTYRYVHKKFEDAGVKNVSWMFSPNEAGKGNVMSYYPGDKYVDWIGFSGFNWGNSSSGSGWRTFEKIYSKSFSQVAKIKKPISLVEIGSVEDPKNDYAKARWITNTFKSIENKYPQVKMIVWYNGKSFNKYDWRVNTSQDSLNAFKKVVYRDYFIDSVRSEEF